MNVSLPKFFTQESGQTFLLAVGGLYLFWKEGASDPLLYMVAGLGAVSIVFEKVKAFAKSKEP